MTFDEIKDDLKRTFDERKNQYDKSKIYLNGVFFHFENKYYPISVIFLPIPTNYSVSVIEEIKNYGDFLFIKGIIEDFNNPCEMIVNGFGNYDHFSFSSLPILLQSLNGYIYSNIQEMRGFFRSIEENSQDISNQLGYNATMRPEMARLLKETCSFPLLPLKAWPSKTYLFSLKIDQKVKSIFQSKINEPLLPEDDKLNPFPDFRSAVTYFFGKEGNLIDDWTAAFSFPNFGTRIEEIIIYKDRIEICIKSSIVNNIIVKHYIEYNPGNQYSGYFNFSEQKAISIIGKPSRLYLWIYNKNKPKEIIDYRNNDWRYFNPYSLIEYTNVKYGVESIEDLIYYGESDYVEFKLDIDSEKSQYEFLETVCSFSNSEKGGKILIGVDDKGNIKGLNDDIVGMLKAKKIPDLIRAHIEPYPKYDFKIHTIRAKKILEVHIGSGDAKPYVDKERGCFIRDKDRDRAARHDELLSLIPVSNNIYSPYE